MDLSFHVWLRVVISVAESYMHVLASLHNNFQGCSDNQKCCLFIIYGYIHEFEDELWLLSSHCSSISVPLGEPQHKSKG